MVDKFEHDMDAVIWRNRAGDRVNPYTGEGVPEDLKDEAAIEIDDDGEIVEKREDPN
tara:strand:+ start:1939 stop:2109 length:171 start_codon:yes stop_codon:yes gene_type:complete